MKDLSGKRVSVRIATSAEDVTVSLMIRAAVFIGEDGCALRDEADGNDFGATHVLGFVDGNPAGTMRIRYFGSFAVLERMAVLKPYRKQRFGTRGVAWEVGEYAFNFCRVKGYDQFYGLARDGLVEFWKKFAPDGAQFTPIPGASLTLKGIIGHPMEGHAPPLPGAVTDMRTQSGMLRRREADLPREVAGLAGELAGIAFPLGHPAADRLSAA